MDDERLRSLAERSMHCIGFRAAEVGAEHMRDRLLLELYTAAHPFNAPASFEQPGTVVTSSGRRGAQIVAGGEKLTCFRAVGEHMTICTIAHTEGMGVTPADR